MNYYLFEGRPIVSDVHATSSTATFCRCPACGKLAILGSTCPCGQRTDLPMEER